MIFLNLFKYYAPKYEKEDNLSFYSKESIYFQQPIRFNDPWDCKAPQISIPRQISSLRDIWSKMAKQGGPAFVKTEWEKIKKVSRPEIKLLFDKLFKEAIEIQRSKIGVFSLTCIPDSELMWSHYASSHSGYMLHFQINITEYYSDLSLKNIGIPVPVIYKGKRDDWNLGTYYNNREKHVYNLVRFKSNAWEYECELRLLNVNNWGFIKTPANWLKSIVIGLNTKSELRSKLRSIGKVLNIPVFRALMNKCQYKIDIPGLEINGDIGNKHYKEIINSKIFELK